MESSAHEPLRAAFPVLSFPVPSILRALFPVASLRAASFRGEPFRRPERGRHVLRRVASCSRAWPLGELVDSRLVLRRWNLLR
jgi:hypothetical protein